MKPIFAVIGGGVLLVALALGADFASNSYDIWHQGFWRPKQAEVDNKVWENSTPYIQGKRNELNRLRRDYKNADDAHKPAIKEEILASAENVKLDQLPEDLRSFVQSLQEDGQ